MNEDHLPNSKIGCVQKPRIVLEVLFLAGFLLSFGSIAQAWSFSNLLGPSVKDAEFSYTFSIRNIKEDPISSELPPLTWGPTYALFIHARMKNNSSYYLTGAKLSCNIYDANGNRLVKDGEFRSSIEPSLAPGNTKIVDFRTGTFSSSVDTWVRIQDAARVDCALAKLAGEK